MINTLEQLCALIPHTAVEALGVEIVSVDSEHILLRMPMSDRARQPMGLLHGGISMVLAESLVRASTESAKARSSRILPRALFLRLIGHALHQRGSQCTQKCDWRVRSWPARRSELPASCLSSVQQAIG